MPTPQDKPETPPRNGTSGGTSAGTSERPRVDSASQAYDAWSGFYQRMTEESMDFFQRGMRMTQEMMPVSPGTEVFRLWTENYQDYMSKLGQDPSVAFSGDYRKMYDLWLDTWTKNFESYMRTPEFAAKSGRDLEAFSDMRKRMATMMESYWSYVSLPSTADMREIYQKLYTIERKLDEMDRRIRTSENEGKSRQEGKKP